MARENSIAVSDDELDSLKSARLDIFGTDELPYGAVIQRLIDEYDN